MPGHAVDRTKRLERVIVVKLTSDIGACKREIVDAIQRRAYEIFEARGRANGRENDDWLQAESELLCPIELDVQEVDNLLIVKATLPGFGTDEFEVNVEPRTLTIAGQKKQARTSEGKEPSPAPQRAKWVFRTLELPRQVLPDKVTAHFRDGVLEVILPQGIQKQEAKSISASA